MGDAIVVTAFCALILALGTIDGIREDAKEAKKYVEPEPEPFVPFRPHYDLGKYGEGVTWLD